MKELSTEELIQALNNNNSNSHTVISRMSNNEKEAALDTLADAFKEDPYFSWVADFQSGDTEKERKMKTMNKYFFQLQFYLYRGVPMVIKDRNNQVVGTMNICPSSSQNESILRMLLAMVKYGFPPMYKSKEKKMYGPNSRRRLEASEILVKRRKAHMKGIKRWIYLPCIGIRSDQQGSGHGKKLLELLFATADSLQVPVYLETESKGNENLYKRFGFRTLEEHDLVAPNDESPTARMTMYLMKRDSQ